MSKKTNSNIEVNIRTSRPSGSIELHIITPDKTSEELIDLAISKLGKIRKEMI